MSNTATIEIISPSHLSITVARGCRGIFYVNDVLVAATDGSHGELMYLFVI